MGPTFLKRNSLIFKKLWIYSVASNYIRPVQTIYLITLTYTFNYCHCISNIVKGEIQKNTLPNRSTNINNKLAPKFQNFFINIPQTGTFMFVKTNKNKYSSLNSNKTCEVSFDTILFIEKINKIEDNKSDFEILTLSQGKKNAKRHLFEMV
jgi:hypothetical protein